MLTRERGMGGNGEDEGEKKPKPCPRLQARGPPHTSYLNAKGIFLNTAPEHWGPSPGQPLFNTWMTSLLLDDEQEVQGSSDKGLTTILISKNHMWPKVLLILISTVLGRFRGDGGGYTPPSPRMPTAYSFYCEFLVLPWLIKGYTSSVLFLLLLFFKYHAPFSFYVSFLGNKKRNWGSVSHSFQSSWHQDRQYHGHFSPIGFLLQAWKPWEGLKQQEAHVTLKWNSLTFGEDVEGSADWQLNWNYNLFFLYLYHLLPCLFREGRDFSCVLLNAFSPVPRQSPTQSRHSANFFGWITHSRFRTRFTIFPRTFWTSHWAFLELSFF